MGVGRDERERRSGHEERDRGQLLGRAGRDGNQPPEHVARGRQEERTAEHEVDRLQRVLEAGHDPEVAAAPANRPEQVRVRRLAHGEQAAVRRDQLDGDQVVDRQAVLAGQEADPAAERDPGDPDRRGVAERGRQAVGRRGAGVLAGREARLCPRTPAPGVQLEAAHLGEIDHDRAVRDGVAGRAVAPSTHGQPMSPLPREPDGAAHVGRVRNPDDEARVPVDAGIVDLAGKLVLGVPGRDGAPGKPGAQRGDGGWSDSAGGLGHRFSLLGGRMRGL